jgi:hypothetical protein
VSSELEFGEQAKVVGRCAYDVVFGDRFVSFVVEGFHGEVSDNFNFMVVSLLFVFGVINNVIGSPGWKSSVSRHGVSSLLLFLAGPLAEKSFAFFPHIDIARNNLILLPTISKVEISRYDAQIHTFIHLLNVCELADSFFGMVQTFKMDAVYSKSKLFTFFLGEFEDGCKCASSHCGHSVWKWLLVESAWEFSQNDGVVRVHFHVRNKVVLKAYVGSLGIEEKDEELLVDLLQAYDVCARIS